MPAPMTTTSAARGSFSSLATSFTVGDMNGTETSPVRLRSKSGSMEDILEFVVRPDKGQEPCRSKMPGDGRPGEPCPGIGGSIAVHDLGHDLPHMGRHLGSVTAISHGVVESLMLARAGQPVGSHVDHAAPAIVDPRLSEAGKHRCHRMLQNMPALDV